MQRKITKKINSILLLFCVILIMSSCGFKSIYNLDDQDSKSIILGTIKVQASNKRINQILKNHIYDLINPHNIDYESKFILLLSINKNVSSTYITKTGSSGRNRLLINVEYKLMDIANSKIILSNVISLSDNYDVTQNRYSTLKIEEYVLNNILKIIAQDIRNEIIQYLL